MSQVRKERESKKGRISRNVPTVPRHEDGLCWSPQKVNDYMSSSVLRRFISFHPTLKEEGIFKSTNLSNLLLLYHLAERRLCKPLENLIQFSPYVQLTKTGAKNLLKSTNKRLSTRSLINTFSEVNTDTYSLRR